MNRRTLTAAATVLLTLGLTACDGNGDDGGDGAVASGTDLTITMGDMYFEPERVEVPAGEEITFELVNEGGAEHDLSFNGDSSEMVAPGETATFVAGPFDSDTVGWCEVPGHREAGMELEVVVE